MQGLDFVARFGGDEFMLILPEAFRADAKAVADALRAALATAAYVAPDGTRIPLRMSFGASSYPEDGQEAAALIAVADANLYESKRWGGDTVTVRPEPISGEAIDSRAFSTLDSLVSAVDNKDHYTRRHSAQVAEHTALMAKALGLSDEQQEVLRMASLLHDVGKIGVPDRILRKPGTLTAKELDYMRQHPLIGSMMISQHMPESVGDKGRGGGPSRAVGRHGLPGAPPRQRHTPAGQDPRGRGFLLGDDHRPSVPRGHRRRVKPWRGWSRASGRSSIRTSCGCLSPASIRAGTSGDFSLIYCAGSGSCR